MPQKKKKRPGRRPNPPAEQRRYHFSMKLTKLEYDILKAASAPLPLTTWGRIVMLEAAGADPKKVIKS